MRKERLNRRESISEILKEIQKTISPHFGAGDSGTREEPIKKRCSRYVPVDRNFGGSCVFRVLIFL